MGAVLTCSLPISHRRQIKNDQSALEVQGTSRTISYGHITLDVEVRGVNSAETEYFILPVPEILTASFSNSPIRESLCFA